MAQFCAHKSLFFIWKLTMLERQSAAAGVSKSDLTREALRRFLAASEFQRLRAKFVKRARAQNIHTDEDVFRALNKL